MTASKPVIVLLSILFLPLAFAGAQGKVALIKVEGPITKGVADYVENSLRYASEIGAEGLIIVLNTDGGFLQATEQIVTAISSSPIPTAVYVPPGGRAFSAGSFILMASYKACMGPGSSVGAAEPRPKDEKVVNALASLMRSLAKSSSRNETAAELFVKENLALTADEALKYGVVECVSKDIDGFIDELGWSHSVVEINPDVRVAVLLVITDPVNTWVLFLIGVILLLLGLTHPTYIMEGVGAILLILSLYALGLMGASLASILLMLLGALTIFLELKTGHGLLALTGAIIAAFGLFLLYESSPLISPSLSAEVMVATMIAVAGIVGFYLYKIREALERRPSVLDPSLLIGKEGVVKVSVGPGREGVVLIGSELWTAVSDEDIDEGEKARVVSIEGFKVKVVRA